MNRAFLLTAAPAVPLLADAALKSTVLLVLAGICALLMHRASAAARHMVWLAVVLALLLVPVLSVTLPGWRVLPEWAAVGRDRMQTFERTQGTGPSAAPSLPQPATGIPDTPANPAASPPPLEALLPAPSLPVPVAAPAAALPPSAAPTPASAASWILLAWATGCALLLLRLTAARWLLRCTGRRCESVTGPLAAAFAAAVRETGVRQHVRLLLDQQRTIPLVWGIFLPRLLLPAEALTWETSQLRSVLLHELAHLRRRDPLAQTLTQIACALYWFNPLIWLAAWRLHVERERACDDLVLAGGVRPSEYAGHLLQMATQLHPARWAAGGGLAMARQSSLEGRLLAVLSDKLNRRGLTRTLTAAAILFSAAVAVPVAMLRSQYGKPAGKPARTAAESNATRLDANTEAQLDWGEAVNGLRGAVVVRVPATGAQGKARRWSRAHAELDRVDHAGPLGGIPACTRRAH